MQPPFLTLMRPLNTLIPSHDHSRYTNELKSHEKSSHFICYYIMLISKSSKEH